MKNFIIRITDPAAVDQQIAVFVTKGGDLGRAAQLAINDMLATHAGEFAFPLFIDIHPADDFALVAPLYEAPRKVSVGLN